MTLSLAQRETLDSLLLALCDGQLAQERVVELERLALSDPEAMAHYVRVTNLQVGLRWMTADGCESSETARGGLPIPPTRTDSNSCCPPVATPSFLSAPLHGTLSYFSSAGWPVAYLAATVILGIGLLIGAVTHVSQVQFAGLPSPACGRGAGGESNWLPSTFGRGAGGESNWLPSPPGRGAGGEGGLTAGIAQSSIVGRITGTLDCRFAADSRLPSPARGRGAGGEGGPSRGSPVALGDKFNLVSGLLEIKFDSGARVILQGPVSYQVESPAAGFLSLGKLTARLENTKARDLRPKTKDPNPKSPNLQISKFVVRTPTATVTDLGTEFGVEVGNEGRTEVHVFRGVVETRSTGVHGGPSSSRRLTEGCAVEIPPGGPQLKTVAFAPQSFTRALPTTADTPIESAYIDAVLADKPLGYWPLNEPAGSRKFFDRSGNGAHGYATGKIAAGRSGPMLGECRAIELGGGEHVDCGIRNQFALKNDFTIEAWVRIGKLSPCSKIISALGQSGSNRAGWAFGAGPVPSGTNSDEKPLVFYLTTISDYGRDFMLYRFDQQELGNRWCHMALVFDRDSVARLYLDGQQRGAAVTCKSVTVGTVWLTIGCGDIGVDGDYWRGGLAHVAVYLHALSQEHIQRHYDAAHQRGPLDNRRQ